MNISCVRAFDPGECVCLCVVSPALSDTPELVEASLGEPRGFSLAASHAIDPPLSTSSSSSSPGLGGGSHADVPCQHVATHAAWHVAGGDLFLMGAALLLGLEPLAAVASAYSCGFLLHRRSQLVSRTFSHAELPPFLMLHGIALAVSAQLAVLPSHSLYPALARRHL